MFELYLADRLRMTRSRLRAEMSNEEYVTWYAWHAKRAQDQEVEQKMSSAARPKGGAGRGR